MVHVSFQSHIFILEKVSGIEKLVNVRISSAVRMTLLIKGKWLGF